MLEIGSSQTGQKLFTVRAFEGGRVDLPVAKARLLLEFLRDLNDASIFIQVWDAAPTPAWCMLGGAVEQELARRHRDKLFGSESANDAESGSARPLNLMKGSV